MMVIGDIDALPLTPRLGVKGTIQRLSKNTGLVVNLALSYSARREIVQAVKNICAQVRQGSLEMDAIDEKLVSEQMQTRPIGDPDLLIRTSGEMRISNFLLWQLAYTELFITDTLWPDFRHHDFFAAIEDFQRRERRFGKVSEQVR